MAGHMRTCAFNSTREQTNIRDIIQIAKKIEFLQKTREQVLDYVPLYLTNGRLVLLKDASFANAEVIKRQFEYSLIMADDEVRCNVIHFGSNKCKPFARSVMAAEIQALVLGFEKELLALNLEEELMGPKVR